jgi:hypothetical protein
VLIGSDRLAAPVPLPWGRFSGGEAAPTFASGNDIWRWTYILVIQGAESVQALL